MSRKVRRVPYKLDTKVIKRLSQDVIEAILRAAGELIMSGGRTLLTKTLKGSHDKSILEHDLWKAVDYKKVRARIRQVITAIKSSQQAVSE